MWWGMVGFVAVGLGAVWQVRCGRCGEAGSGAVWKEWRGGARQVK